MRSSFVVLLLVATLFADAKNMATNLNGRTFPELQEARRYLKTGTVAFNENSAKNFKDEERVLDSTMVEAFLRKFPSVNQLYENVIKSLDKAKMRSESLSQFFAENPAIKKEVIVAATLLTLIVVVPIIVNSRYTPRN